MSNKEAIIRTLHQLLENPEDDMLLTNLIILYKRMGKGVNGNLIKLLNYKEQIETFIARQKQNGNEKYIDADLAFYVVPPCHIIIHDKKIDDYHEMPISDLKIDISDKLSVQSISKYCGNFGDKFYYPRNRKPSDSIQMETNNPDFSDLIRNNLIMKYVTRIDFKGEFQNLEFLKVFDSNKIKYVKLRKVTDASYIRDFPNLENLEITTNDIDSILSFAPHISKMFINLKVVGTGREVFEIYEKLNIHFGHHLRYTEESYNYRDAGLDLKAKLPAKERKILHALCKASKLIVVKDPYR